MGSDPNPLKRGIRDTIQTRFFVATLLRVYLPLHAGSIAPLDRAR